MRRGEELRAELEERRARVGDPDEERVQRAENRRLRRIEYDRQRAPKRARCSLCLAGNTGPLSPRQADRHDQRYPCHHCGRAARPSRMIVHRWLERWFERYEVEKGMSVWALKGTEGPYGVPLEDGASTKEVRSAVVTWLEADGRTVLAEVGAKGPPSVQTVRAALWAHPGVEWSGSDGDGAIREGSWWVG